MCVSRNNKLPGVVGADVCGIAQQEQEGLYFSIAWRIADIEAWQGLSLAIGLALVQTLEKHLNVQNLQLKWPNDILYADKKLGGVLIEIPSVYVMQTNAPVLVIGVGINCQRSLEGTTEPNNERAYLSGTFSELDQNQLVAELITAIALLLQDYESKQFTAYRADWQRYDALSRTGSCIVINGKYCNCRY